MGPNCIYIYILVRLRLGKYIWDLLDLTHNLVAHRVGLVPRCYIDANKLATPS